LYDELGNHEGKSRPKAKPTILFCELALHLTSALDKSSAQLSQIPYSFGQFHLPPRNFSVGKLDADLQQVDCGEKQQWRFAIG